MSRYIKKIGKEKDVVYGFDKAEGYFFQLFIGVEEDERIPIDESSLFTKMSNAKMMGLMQEYGVSETHISSVALDLPF